MQILTAYSTSGFTFYVHILQHLKKKKKHIFFFLESKDVFLQDCSLQAVTVQNHF